MELDKNKIYSTLNADELKIGSKVIVANTYGILKHDVLNYVANNKEPEKLIQVLSEYSQYRFQVDDGHNSQYALAYLVEEPEEKKLKWTDLKVGDAITNGNMECMVVSIDKKPSAVFRICVITDGGNDWLSDQGLEDWEKVENESKISFC